MMPPGIRDLDRLVENLFWRKLTKTVLVILAGAVVLAGLIIWRFV